MTMLTLAILLCAPAVVAADQTIDLGGLRQVQVNLRTPEDNYELQVRFLSVTCFDQATNQEMNLGLGRSYALQALATNLAGKQNVDVEVSGARTASSGHSGKFFTMVLLVPRNGVRLIEHAEATASNEAGKGGGDASTKSLDRAGSDGGVLSRKGQYDREISQLGRLLGKELKQLKDDAGSSGLSASQADGFRSRINTAFDQLASEIQGDLELTNLGSDLDPSAKGDKDKLLDALAATRSKLLQELKAASGG
jgi:hypothetical protein